MELLITSGPGRGTAAQAIGDRFTLGRGDACDLVIPGDSKISGLHAYLTVLDDGRAIITDCGSTNGTSVDGATIDLPVLLHGGEELRLGDTLLRVSPGDGPRHTVRLARPAPTPTLAPTPSADVGASFTVLAAKPVEVPAAGRSTLQRVNLSRSVRKATILATVALLVAVAVVVSFVSGVLPRGGKDRTPAQPRPPTVAEIVQGAAPSTVQVLTLKGARPLSSGTGWVLDAPRGLVVTNNHVVNGGTAFRVGVGDEERSAELVAAAPCEDLALLRVSETSKLTTMPLGSQRALKLGDLVVAVGFPANASSRSSLTATTGVVSVVQTSVRGSGMEADLSNTLQTDAAINPGNSGGPLLNDRGLLVGVNTASLVSLGGRDFQNSNYAIGVDKVKEVTAVLAQGRSVGWTGVALESPSDSSELTDLGLPARRGLLITAAVPGTPASAAGLGQEPSLLVAVDGRPIDRTLRSYCEAVQGQGSGSTARFSVIRPRTTEAVEVVVALA